MENVNMQIEHLAFPPSVFFPFFFCINCKSRKIIPRGKKGKRKEKDNGNIFYAPCDKLKTLFVGLAFKS